MAEKKKASQRSVPTLRNSRLRADKMDDSNFGGPPVVPITGSITGNKHWEIDKKPMTKVMMRLPRSLALEFQQTYLQLAALHLQKQGKKLYVQDCHVEMVRDWLEKQKRKLSGKS